MKCWKCDKEMDNPGGDYKGTGLLVDVNIGDFPPTPENIAYANRQFGKYSDGQGKCHVGICYECYIDGLCCLQRSLG